MGYWVGMAVLSVLTAEKGTKILSKCNKSITMKRKKLGMGELICNHSNGKMKA